MKYIISESRLEDFIYEYLTSNYYPDYNWGPDSHNFFSKEVDLHGFYEFEIDGQRAYYYRGDGMNKLYVSPWIGDKLDNLFGDRWNQIFIKWFEDNSGLPVKNFGVLDYSN